MNKNYTKKLGCKIRQIRKSKGLSQERLAELIDKSRNYVGMIERAEINMPTSVLFDISSALNCEPKKFFEF